MSFRIIILLVLTILVKSSAAQQKLSKKEFHISVDSVIQYYIAQKNLPGAVLLIKKGNKTFLHTAYGFAQLKDKDDNPLKEPIRMRKNYMFDIASLTKVIGTTTAIMYLADNGLISVDDEVSKYISAFNFPEKKNITIRHLLTHTSGLYAWYPMYYKSSNKIDTYLLISKLPFILTHCGRNGDCNMVLSRNRYGYLNTIMFGYQGHNNKVPGQVTWAKVFNFDGPRSYKIKTLVGGSLISD